MKKRRMIFYIISWLVVFAVLSIFIKPVKITNCVAQDGRILVTGRSGYELSITYEKITAIEYRREVDYGILIEGMDDGKEKSGRWENNEWGEYLLCVNANVKACIVLYINEQTMVINYESERSTRALCNALLEQMYSASDYE